jgi:hypothetical protein
MAGRGAPTFLKRQKEQNRMARAQAKREAKQAKRDRRAAAKSEEPLDEEVSPELTDQDPKPDDSPEA